MYSDNQSLVENLTKQLDAWRANGFAKSLRRIGDAIGEKQLAVRFQWVRGHAGNAGNERADEERVPYHSLPRRILERYREVLAPDVDAPGVFRFGAAAPRSRRSNDRTGFPRDF